MSKEIDPALIFAQIVMATTTETNIGYVSDSEDLVDLTNKLTKSFKELINISKERFPIAKHLKKDFCFQENIISLLLHIDNPKNKEQAENELESMREEYKSLVKMIHESVNILNQISQEGKLPKVVVESRKDGENIWTKHEDDTLIVNDPAVATFIECLNSLPKNINLSDSKIIIDKEDSKFALLEKKIPKEKKEVSGEDYFTDVISILSVNSDDMYFRFKNSDNSKQTCHYGNIDNRNILLDAQKQDRKVRCRMSYLEEISLTKTVKKDFKLVEIVDDENIMR